MAHLRIESYRDDETAVLRLVGDLDAATGADLERVVRTLFEDGTRSLAFDCGAVGFMDSTGLRVIISAEQVAHRLGGSVSVRRPADNVRRIMEITGIADLISDG